MGRTRARDGSYEKPTEPSGPPLMDRVTGTPLALKVANTLADVGSR